MKRILFSAAWIAALAVSCSRPGGADLPASGEGRTCEVLVSIQDTPGTRAVGTTYADEARVNSLQVFVFNGEDREAYRHAGAAMQALIPATTGERTVWAVVNAPDLSSVETISGLLSAVSRLSDNVRTDGDGTHLDSFVMTGSTTQELVDGGTVPISVRRIVARVSIARISTDLKDYRKDYQVRVKALYLINVAADSRYDAGGEAGGWLNRLGHSDAALDPLLYDGLADVVIRNGEPYTVEHAFYPYPNIHPTPAESAEPVYDDQWNPRGTILVIEASMYEGDGQTLVKSGYYPIVLPAIQRNKTYVIEEVCITRLPGDVPYRPIETGESQVTVSVSDWEVGLNLGTVTI